MHERVSLSDFSLNYGSIRKQFNQSTSDNQYAKKHIPAFLAKILVHFSNSNTLQYFPEPLATLLNGPRTSIFLKFFENNGDKHVGSKGRRAQQAEIFEIRL